MVDGGLANRAILHVRYVISIVISSEVRIVRMWLGGREHLSLPKNRQSN